MKKFTNEKIARDLGWKKPKAAGYAWGHPVLGGGQELPNYLGRLDAIVAGVELLGLRWAVQVLPPQFIKATGFKYQGQVMNDVEGPRAVGSATEYANTAAEALCQAVCEYLDRGKK